MSSIRTKLRKQRSLRSAEICSTLQFVRPLLAPDANKVGEPPRWEHNETTNAFERLPVPSVGQVLIESRYEYCGSRTQGCLTMIGGPGESPGISSTISPPKPSMMTVGTSPVRKS